MACLEQMAQLVDHYILQTLGRMRGKLHVYANTARFDIAAAPTAYHIAIRKLSRLHTHDGRPTFHKRRHKRRHHSTPFGDFFGSGRAETRLLALDHVKTLSIDPIDMR